MTATGYTTDPAPEPTGPSYEATEDGPQTANVPTLAWVGEDVRLVACDDSIDANFLGDGRFQEAHFNVNLWTGDQSDSGTPTFDGDAATNLYVTNTGSAFFFPPTRDDATDDKGCVSADVSSLHAGLSEVTLNVYQEPAGDGQKGITDGEQGGDYSLDPTPVYSEQFWVAWMTAGAPVLTEASQNSLSFPGGSTVDQLTSTGVTNVGKFLGDTATIDTFPSLDASGADTPWDCDSDDVTDISNTHEHHPGEHDCGANNTPSSNNGLIDIRVTGTFPIEDAYDDNTNSSYFGTAAYVMPRDWVKLADILAYSSTTQTPPGSDPSLWDIHGGPTNGPGHVTGTPATSPGGAATAGGPCFYDAGPWLQTTDAVDDCVSDGSGDGNAYAFSTVFGDITSGDGGAGIGPYDAQAPDETLLSDGRLNADDAPMPALPVTVSIAANTGAAGDISGIGGLYGVAKWLVYSHDFDGSLAGPVALETDAKTANLYNPYYQEYIPSTSRPLAQASGITGVYDNGGNGSGTSGDDFPGFDNGRTNPYTFWTALDAASLENPNATNTCAEYFESTDNGAGEGAVVDYPTPDYPTSVVVYTDERGEAYVDYNPGTGWYDNGYVGDKDGACDLQSLLGKPIGTSTISAQVEYPYEAVPYVPPSSGPGGSITKTVLSDWSKTLTAYPKGNSGSDTSVVVASATNVNGQPITDEEVCISSSPAESIYLDEVPFTGPNGTVDISGTNSQSVPSSISSNNVCADTNSKGLVGWDVSGSENPTVDVLAIFVPEHIYRDVTVTLGQTTPVTSTQPPTVIPSGDEFPAVPTTGSAGSSGGSNSSSGSSGGTSGGTSLPAPSAAKVASVCKVESVRLHHVNGKYTVSFKVSCSSAKSLSVTIRAYKANGKLLRTIRETVRANKSLSVSLGSKKVGHVTVIA